MPQEHSKYFSCFSEDALQVDGGVNILLALGCKTVDALAYYAGVAAEIDLKLKLEQVFDRWVGKGGDYVPPQIF